MKPTRNNILVMPFATESKTASGIILTSEPRKELRGRVVAVGNKVVDIVVDDIIMFESIVGKTTLEGTELYVVNEDTVYLVE